MKLERGNDEVLGFNTGDSLKVEGINREVIDGALECEHVGDPRVTVKPI